MSAKTFSKYLTEAEEKTLIKTIARVNDIYAKRDLQWILLARNTGIRVTPLSKLTVADATHAITTGYFEIRGLINKRGNSHRMHLNKSATKALKNLLKIRTEMGGKNNPDAPLILSRNRKAMSVRSFQARLQYWANDAGIHCTPHALRHTFGKRIIQNSTSAQSLQIAQKALGHKNIQSTTIYTEPDKETLQQAIEEAGS